MMYSELTNIQRRCVDVFVDRRPHLRTANTITRKEIVEIFNELYEARSVTAPKIGFPVWIVKGNILSRGVYEFPGPEAKEASAGKTSQTSYSSEEDREFFQELEENGITV